MPARGLRRFSLFITILIATARFSSAQDTTTTFAHLSSLWLFDENSGSSNRRAFADAIQKLNSVGETQPIRFAVVTGSLGLRDIFLKQTAKPACAFSNFGPDRVATAAALADSINDSHIPIWLFLPGRDDRLQGCSDPLSAYQQLLAEVRRQLGPRGGRQVVNLSDSPFSPGSVAVIGLDSSGFDGAQPVNEAVLQALATALKNRAEKTIVLATSSPRVGGFKRGADDTPPWNLSAEGQNSWSSIIGDDRVQVVLAGDVDSADSQSYRDFRGLFRPSFLSGDITRLYIAPPLGARSPSIPEDYPRGYEVLRLTNGVVTSRTFYWKESDGFRSEPGSEAALWMRAGEIYEQSGRLSEAETWYRKALEAKGSDQTAKSLQSVRRVINTWGLWELWIKHRLWITAVVAAFLVLLGLGRIWSRKSRLRVFPLDIPKDANIPPSHLERMAEHFVYLMRYQASRQAGIDTTKLPLVWRGLSQDLKTALEGVPQPGIVNWMVGVFFRAKFELRGTVASSATAHQLVLTLTRKGKHLRSWERSVLIADTHDALKDLVYDVLLYIKAQST